LAARLFLACWPSRPPSAGREARERELPPPARPAGSWVRSGRHAGPVYGRGRERREAGKLVRWAKGALEALGARAVARKRLELGVAHLFEEDLVDVLVLVPLHPDAGDVEDHLARRDGVAVATRTAPARAVARPLRAGELG
jgi:hypothetical protein